MHKRTGGMIVATGFLIIITACTLPGAVGDMLATPTKPTDTATLLPPSETATSTPNTTPTPTPSATPTPTIQPTYAFLRANVIPERLSCRFGPGVMYLFEFSVYGKIEVIGRMEGSSWVLVRAIGGKNSCWVNGDYLELLGEKAVLEPKDPHVVLPWSPYYGPLTGVSAVREGDTVTVFWDPLYLRAGDDSLQVPYVVEAWVCQDGEFVFSPVGAYVLAAEVRDEPGCEEESHGRVFAAEKHGYTQWIKIKWPPYEEVSTPEP
jgi:hypothetical protein